LSEQGIPHSSPLCSIIVFFYNADPIDVYTSPDLPATGIGVIDDANVLAFAKTTEKTC
jgi:uncharacterized membrane protein YkvA (DUF1232 family)